MEQFIKNFHREGPGKWVCVSPATLTTPQGRVQVTQGMRFTFGQKFMNVEVSALLEAEYQRQLGRE